LITLFTISGCANRPNLIPHGGYAEIFNVPDRSEMAARVDYPIVVAVEPALEPINASQIMILWTTKGEIIWNEPFWNKVTWWRFALIAEGEPVGTPALCSTTWAQALSEGTKTEVPCHFKVMNHLAMPLIGILDYRLGGDRNIPPEENEASDGVARLYYIVNK
jgi:hypothetical protein